MKNIVHDLIPAKKPIQRRQAALYAGLVAVVGVVIVVAISAAGGAVVLEAENGSLTGGAAVVTAAGTSGSGAVKFAAVTTPAPTPTPPVGGTRTCPAFPAFPNDACTGVPPGVSLSATGSIVSSTAGQVIDARLVNGDVVVNHNNVTIKNTRVKGAIINKTSSRGLVIQDSDIGGDTCPVASNGGTRLVGGEEYTLLRSRVHHNGADLMLLSGGGNIIIQDNIINRGCYYSGDHLDAIQLYDPGSLVKATIVHNVVDTRPSNNSGNGNGAIFWSDRPGSGSRLTVYHNLLSGGNYTLSANDATAGSGVIVDIHDNRFSRGTYTYGPCNFSNSNVFDGTSGYKVMGNAFDDGGSINGC